MQNPKEHEDSDLEECSTSLDSSSSQRNVTTSKEHDRWECDSLVEICSLVPVPPVAKTGALEQVGNFCFFPSRRFFSLQDGSLDSWSTKKGYINCRPCKHELNLRGLKDMEQDGNVLKLNFTKEGKRKLEVFRAASDSEAADWFDTVEAALRSMSMPIIFSVQEKDIFQPTVLKEFQLLVDHCFISKSTRDRKGEKLPKGLQVVKVVKVLNSTLLREYYAKRDQIADDLTDEDRQKSKEILTPDVRTSLLDKPLTVLPQLDERTIERWVFHGTKPEGLEGIANASFDMNRAGTGGGLMYGKGIYCAGCCSKADEYTKEDKNGIRGLLLCRANLGKILYSCELKPNVAYLQQEQARQKCHTILGDRWKAAGTYREFVLSSKAQVYPEFIIYYLRMY